MENEFFKILFKGNRLSQVAGSKDISTLPNNQLPYNYTMVYKQKKVIFYSFFQHGKLFFPSCHYLCAIKQQN